MAATISQIPEINNVCFNQNRTAITAITAITATTATPKKIRIKKKKMEIDTTTAPHNRGTGAGGANTNIYGKAFEEKTNNQPRLLEHGFAMSRSKQAHHKYEYFLSKTFADKTITFVMQHGLKVYMKNRYGIDLFRCPDEAYIIECADGRRVIKILEKKEQNVEGSVETKLWSAPALKREYEIVLGPEFEVSYGFCVSEFLKRKLCSGEVKYRILNQIFAENAIAVLYGDDADYFHHLDDWIDCCDHCGNQ